MERCYDLGVLLRICCLIVMCLFGWGKALAALGDDPALDGSLRYDEVCWVCSHNSMNNSQEGFVVPNQTASIAQQLKDGVHAQMWDVWMQDGGLVLRHGGAMAQMLGSVPLSLQLGVVKKYLLEKPHAVLTLLFESYVPAKDLAAEIEKAGLKDFCYIQERGKAWSTLAEMRRTGKRLVLFVDRAADAPAWLMPMWDHCLDTPWEAARVEDFQNVRKRGDDDNSLLIVNHFLSVPFPSFLASAKVNDPVLIQQRVKDIRRDMKRAPQFWVLDFYQQNNAYRALP